MLVNSSIPSLHNGVSQQSETLRLPSQAEVQLNAVSSLADGVGKRSPTQHVAKLAGPLDRGDESQFWSKVHWINRDDQEQYVCIFEQGRVKVFDLDGVEYPVVSTAYEFDYIEVDNPHRDLEVLSIADTTFIVNKTKVPELLMDSAYYAPLSRKGALLTVKAANYATTYNLQVNGMSFGYITPATLPEDLDPKDNPVTTVAIAKALYRKLRSNLVPTGFTVRYRDGDSCVFIQKTGGGKFTCEMTDSRGNQDATILIDQAGRFDELPPVAPNGLIVKIMGDPEAQTDDYYVTFVADNGDLGPGLWQECPEPGLPMHLDARTMPHVLNRRQDDDRGTFTGESGSIYFELSKADWRTRDVGDDDTNPVPSFVTEERPITNIFLFRNRLGFLSGSNVVMSRSGDFFDFFRQTALELRDDDPIDVSAATPKILDLRYAVPFNEVLLLFAESTQAVLRGGDLLTPKTVSIAATTEIESEPLCAPINVEDMVFFPFRHGQYAGVREYFLSADGQSNDSNDVTDHVPHYIPDYIYRLIGNASQSSLITLSAGDRQNVWLYQYKWNGPEKVQSAWSKWDLGDGSLVRGMEFYGTSVYFVISRGCGTYLERMDWGRDSDPNADYITHLDRRLDDKQLVRIEYDETDNTTTYTLPFKPDVEPMVASRVSTTDSGWAPAVIYPVIATEGCPEPEPEEPPVDPPVDPPDEPEQAVVNITAPDPEASEDGTDLGLFVITREGSTNEPLTVNLVITGTATHLTDYTLTSSDSFTINFPTATIVIPAGSTTSSIVVTGIPDVDIEGLEWVDLTLGPADDQEYTHGPDFTARVNIIDDDVPSCTPANLNPLQDIVFTFYGIANPGRIQPGEAADEGQWSGLDDGTEVTVPAGWDISAPAVSIAGTSLSMWNGPAPGGILAGGHPAPIMLVPTVVYDAPNARYIVRLSLKTNLGGSIPIFETETTEVFQTCTRYYNRHTSLYPANPEPVLGYDGYVIATQGGATLTPPTAPSNPAAATPTTTSIVVTWDDNSSNEAGFRIERSLTPSTGFSVIQVVGPNVETYTDTGLTPGTTYYYRVQAFNSAGDSAYTSEASNTTLGGGGVPNDTFDLFNTGEDIGLVPCGYQDRKWSISGSGAKVHPTPISPLWMTPREGSGWISYDFITEAANQATQVDRDFATTINIPSDINLATLVITGKFAADDRVVDVMVNGTSKSITMPSGTNFNKLTAFSIPAGHWKYGSNTIKFKVRTASGNAPNPTGLLVEWDPIVSAYALQNRAAERTFVDPDFDGDAEEIVVSKDAIAAVDECSCTYKITVKGDLRDKPVYVGIPYTFQYEFTTPRLREQSPLGGINSHLSGRLQIRSMNVAYSDTGYFRVRVEPEARQAVEYVFTAREIGRPITSLDQVPNASGEFKFAVMSKNDQASITLLNDSILPSWFTSASWTGVFSDKSRKL